MDYKASKRMVYDLKTRPYWRVVPPSDRRFTPLRQLRGDISGRSRIYVNMPVELKNPWALPTVKVNGSTECFLPRVSESDIAKSRVTRDHDEDVHVPLQGMEANEGVNTDERDLA